MSNLSDHPSGTHRIRLDRQLGERDQYHECYDCGTAIDVSLWYAESTERDNPDG